MIINLWNDFNPKDTMGYPYNKVDIIRSRYFDRLGRSASWLLASLTQYLKILLEDRDTVAPRDQHTLCRLPVPLVNRLCKKQVEPSDIAELLSMSTRDDLCAVYDLALIQNMHQDEWRSKNLPDLNEHSEVILYQCLSRDKAVIFRLQVSRKAKKKTLWVDIDGYFLGDVTCTESDPFTLLIHQVICLFLSNATLFQFRRRLHVPPSFFADNNYMTFLIINYLQYHGNYLDISVESIARTQLDHPHIQKLLAIHDNSFLGQLDLVDINEQSHPFVTIDFKGKDYLGDLANMGWHVIDVVGDGNCGFYTFFLSLENVGCRIFHADTQQQAPKKMSQNHDWMKALHMFRRTMKDHSIHLLNHVYPKGKRDFAELMWNCCCCFR